MKIFHHILGAKTFEVHLQNVSEVSTRAVVVVQYTWGLQGKHLTYFTT